MSLENRVALVTGGGRGIGAKIALRLAEEKARVVICGTTPERLDETADEIRRRDATALAVRADIADEAQVKAMFDQTRRELGEVQILINNAGIAGPTAGIAEISLRDWDRTLAVNLTGAFLCCREAAPSMIARQWGKIINISSMAGKVGYPLRTPYAASKWAMIGMTLTLARELGSSGIQVNAICPGPIQGERMQRVIRARAEQQGRPIEKVARQFVASTALGRMATEDEVAAMVIYLLSDSAAAITGQAIDVAAGYGI